MFSHPYVCTCFAQFADELEAVDHVRANHCRSVEERNDPLLFRDRVLIMISPSFADLTLSWHTK